MDITSVKDSKDSFAFLDKESRNRFLVEDETLQSIFYDNLFAYGFNIPDMINPEPQVKFTAYIPGLQKAINNHLNLKGTKQINLDK